jgi:hypothetical protein
MPPPVTRRERLVSAAVCVIWAGLVVALAGATGALGVSRNDDWVYYRVAFATWQDGGFAPDPYTRAMLVGHITLARPVLAVFGPSMLALQLLVATLSALALWCTYLLLRGFLRPGLALLAVATLALGPIYAGITPTFMTDVPTFAYQSIALLVAARAMRERRLSRPWLAAALLAAFAGFTVREYAAAAAAAIVAAAWWRFRPGTTTPADPATDADTSRSDRRFVIALGAGWLVAATALYLWRTTAFPGPAVTLRLLPDRADVRLAGQAAYTVALLVSPATVYVLFRGGARLLLRHRWVTVVSAVLLLGGTRLVSGVFLGNYVGPRGSYTGTVAGVRPVVVAPAIWSLVVAVAVVSAVMAVVLAVAAVTRVRERRRAGGRAPRHPAAVTITLTYAAAYVTLTVALAVFTTSPFFDRYFVPVVPAVAAAVLWAWQREASLDGSRVPGRVAAWASGVVTGFVTVVALSLVVTSVQFDAAKWRLGTELESRGWSAPTIDAGFEWFGFHQQQPIDPHPRALPGHPFWVSRLFAHPRVCVMVSHERSIMPRSAGDVVARASVWAPLGGTFDLVARPVDLDCPQDGEP